MPYIIIRRVLHRLVRILKAFLITIIVMALLMEMTDRFIYILQVKRKLGYLFDMEVGKNKRSGCTEIETYEKALQDLKKALASDWRKL